MGGAERYLADMGEAQRMLDADAGRPILDSQGRVVLGSDGQPQTTFIATQAQRDDPYGNVFPGGSPGNQASVIPGKERRDAQRLDWLNTPNGQAVPDTTLEEALMGVRLPAKGAKAVVQGAEGKGASALPGAANIGEGGEAAIKSANGSGQARPPASAVQSENLRTELDDWAKMTPDTSQDAQYIAKTDSQVLQKNNFDMSHVLAGEVNAKGKATGYHAEFAADGQARIKPGADITFNANGTYEAPVQIWDAKKGVWVDKFAESTFFPPSWSPARIEYEVSEAFKQGTPGTSFAKPSPGGLNIQFHWDAKNQRTTFYPLKEATP